MFVTLGVLSALAYGIMVIGRIPIITVPFTLKYDPKDIVFVICGFIYGPLPVFAMSIVVSFIEMITVSENGIIGFAMNVLSTCAFACSAAFVYKKLHSLKGAVIGLIVGWIVMAAAMLLYNYLITPFYLASLSLGWSDMKALSETAKNIRPGVAALLIPVFLPFNLLKCGINAAVAMLVYKPVKAGLTKSKLLPEPPSGNAATKVNIGVMIASAFVLLTGVLIVLVYRGII